MRHIAFVPVNTRQEHSPSSRVDNLAILNSSWRFAPTSMPTCIGTRVYTCTGTCTHTCIHTYVGTYIRTCAGTYICTCSGTCRGTCTGTCTGTCIGTYISTYVHIYTSTCTSYRLDKVGIVKRILIGVIQLGTGDMSKICGGWRRSVESSCSVLIWLAATTDKKSEVRFQKLKHAAINWSNG